MDNVYDLIIIGAGTAGLTAAQYAGRSNLKTLVIEEQNEGGQAVLINLLENYPGLSEPLSGYDFSANLKKQAIEFGAEVMSAKVLGIGKKAASFTISIERTGAENEVLLCRTVVLATGADHRKLGIPGEEEFCGKGVSYCATCDGPFFRNKHIVVVGGGDTACDEAGFLAHLTDRITIIHRKDRFRAQKALAERTLHNPHITARFNTIPVEIHGTAGNAGKVTSILIENTLTGEREDLPCDAVFVFVGMTPRTELASLAKTDESGYIITDENMQTSIHGLFAAGDVRSKPFRQIITAAADGAIAAHSASSCIDEDRCEAYK
jgi:thioredoxin reductase (NADPH)